jgi:effector-binding domain-containing protein
MIHRLLALLAALMLAHGALAQQTPALPPPGSLVTPPAAPNPLAPAQNAPQPSNPPSGTAPDQNRMPEIGGPTDIMLAAKPVLMLRGQSNWDDGFDNLMEAFRKLREEAAKHKLSIVAAPQAAFTSTDDYGFKYEAMVTLDSASAQPPALGGEFSLGQSPAGKALKFTHAGAYDDIDTTYEAITAYLDEKGLKSRNVFIEEYATEPKTSEGTELQMNIFILLE